MIYTCTIDTALGAMTASAENGALTGLWFIGQKYYPSKTDTWMDEFNYAVFDTLRLWLGEYFSGKNPMLGLKIEPQGTPFQKAVWEILLKIPSDKLLPTVKLPRSLPSCGDYLLCLHKQ